MRPSREKDTAVARNRKARHEFEIEDTYEAGMVLQGTEVKSLRDGNCSIDEAYARVRGDELWLFEMHIAPYEHGNILNHEPKRVRKLLLHRRQIRTIAAHCSQRGFTLVPLKVYFKGGYAKVLLGLARRRKHWDKRQDKQARQRRKDAEAALSRRRRP
jgi:SsrA-binding protein